MHIAHPFSTTMVYHLAVGQMSSDRCMDRCAKYVIVDGSANLRSRSLGLDQYTLSEELRQGKANSVGGPNG